MESLSRPAHRRKHSAAADAFSGFAGKNPYDDLLLSRGGKGRALGVQEYSEIFAGSPSNIPVLDLSGLDGLAGSDDGQISSLDYSSIFSGLRNHDVAAPYEELVNGSAKRAKPRSRIPADSQAPVHRPGSLHSSGNTKRPSERTPNKSVNGVMEQFNVPFNKSNHKGRDASNGKMDVDHVHSVPGFSYFVDKTSRKQKVEDHKPVAPMKRDVSRTWSFSADVEDVKGKHGASSEKSHMPDVSHVKNEVNVKSKVPPSSNHMPNPSKSKDFKHTRASNFTAKVHASKKIPAEYTPPFLDEEFDENSVAAASAAALRKAIEQAQESIRLAKLIMERKKVGHEDRSRTRTRGHCPDNLGKETEIEDDVSGSKEDISGKVQEDLNAAFLGVFGKHSPSLIEKDALPNAKVETAQEEVEAAKEHGEGFSWRGLLFGLSSNQIQSDSRTAAFGCETGDDKDVSMLSLSKLEPDFGRMETGRVTLEQTDKVVSRAGHGVLVEMEEQGLNAPQRMQDLEKSEEPELYQINFNHANGPKVIVDSLGRVPDDDESWRTGLEEEVTGKRENDMDDVQRPVKLSGGHAEVVGVEPLREQESTFNIFLNQSRKMTGIEANDASGCKENGHDDTGAYDKGGNKMRLTEDCLSLGSEEHLGNVLEEENDVMELSVHPEIGRIVEEVEVCESEVDKKQSYSCDGDEPKLLGKVNQVEIEERHENTSEGVATESQLEARNLAKNEAFLDVQETDSSTLGETGRSEEDCCEERCGDTSDYQADKSPVAEVDDFTELQKNDTFWDVKETKSTHRVTASGEEDHNEERHGMFWDVDGTKVSFKAAGRSEENHNEEKLKITSEHEADENRAMDTNIFAEVMENEPISDAEDTNGGLGPMERSEDHHNVVKFQEAACEERVDDAVNVTTSSASTIFTKSQETCGVDLNNTVAGNYTSPAVAGSLEDMGAEQSFHLKDNGMPKVDSLWESADDRFFVESRQKNASESLASDGKTDNAGVAESVSKESSPEDMHESKTQSGFLSTAQYYSDDNLSIDMLSEHRNEEFELTHERPVLEQPSDSDEGPASTCSPENTDRLSTHASVGCAENVQGATPSKGEVKEPEFSNERKFTEGKGEGLCSPLQTKSNETQTFMEATRTEGGASFYTENKENLNRTATVEKDSKEDVQQRIDAIKRAREREKEKLAVERAIREARERAFAEARERAEKAALDRAAAGVQTQRVTTEAQEKIDKASAVKQSADKASIEAKLRVERAAVERATAEARGRALEKAMSHKTSAETKTAADRNNGLKHSFSSSDLENTTASESAQRSKARLERHQRIMERSAKALAEKNKRDLLAQKEQAERNRLAESLDADIKRWATGKERNLRALLSTLQYILGRDSGWQPIPLTEMLTTAAVKKAYRKATLYVHPDKLQQRGASIRQKYICEKVFDLLQAAWNKFNSEER